MYIRIDSLALRYFKGIRDFTVIFGGNDANVYGDNGLGKTTIEDAFLWLLFDKDSSGATSFGVKTRENGVEIPMVDHVVEGAILIDGAKRVLKKTMREKWVKKRGRADQEFDGHETVYEIDGVPKTKREYEAFVSSLMPESAFRLVTSATYFNQALKWQDRRQMLLDAFGDMSTGDVIASNAELAPLEPILSASPFDDVMKIKKAEKTKINSELSAIPGRIDEAAKAIQETSGTAESWMLKAKKSAADIESLKGERLVLINGGGAQKIKLEIAKIDTAISEMRNKHLRSVPDVSAERKAISELQATLSKLSLSTTEHLQKEEQRLVDRAATLGVEWKSKNAEQFSRGKDCPTCGQAYPESLEDVLEANFNSQKSQELELIVAAGQGNGRELANVRAKIAATIEANNLAIARKAEIEAEIKQVETIISGKQNIPAFETMPEYTEILSRKTALEKTLESEAATTSTATIDAEIAAKEEELKAANHQITLIETSAAQVARVEELRSRQKELASMYEQDERITYLLELFERTRSEMLDASISSQFDLVRWKLSDTLVNGGVVPTCICTVNGVPYPDLNSAGKIQAGLDIIKTLSAKNNFFAPVFVDNAESVTALPEMDCQIIRLIVSEQDKALRISQD